MGRVVVVGAVNVDLVVASPTLPGPGETVVGGELQQFGGGKGANAAVAASRAGADVFLVGAVGKDDMGDGALAELTSDGVDVSAVAQLDDVATGVALIVVDDTGENQIAVGPGANSHVTAAAVRDALYTLVSDTNVYTCVLVSTEIPGDAVLAAVETASELGVTCVLNPAPVTDAVHDALAFKPLLTPNEGELRDLGGADAVVVEGGVTVAVTVGGDGVDLHRPGAGVQNFAATPVEVVDTTGAGDTFNGVLAARLAAGEKLDAAIETAVAAASESVTKLGARAGMPYLDS